MLVFLKHPFWDSPFGFITVKITVTKSNAIVQKTKDFCDPYIAFFESALLNFEHIENNEACIVLRYSEIINFEISKEGY